MMKTEPSLLGTIERRAGAVAGRSQHGFSIVTAIFLIVVLALLGVFIVSVTGLQQSSQQVDLQGVRAYQAARAGIEWAAFQVLDPNNTQNAADCTSGPGSTPIMPACPASPTTLSALAGSLGPFAVTVTCAATATTEGNRQIRVFAITSTATTGTAGIPGYVNRQLQATLSKCHDPTAAAPRCSCG
jgi:MSHA biogenesis protein MshP